MKITVSCSSRPVKPDFMRFSSIKNSPHIECDVFDDSTHTHFRLITAVNQVIPHFKVCAVSVEQVCPAHDGQIRRDDRKYNKQTRHLRPNPSHSLSPWTIKHPWSSLTLTCPLQYDADTIGSWLYFFTTYTWRSKAAELRHRFRLRPAK